MKALSPVPEQVLFKHLMHDKSLLPQISSLPPARVGTCFAHLTDEETEAQGTGEREVHTKRVPASSWEDW